ncbi:hypothetical protein GCM10010466_35570 [Planomonospora alba]|uniref:Uncharacterized protein n=1 Tax=Planomonospora alba TaxID=161354 RepID=A0ABP6NA50_9ACTN
MTAAGAAAIAVLASSGFAAAPGGAAARQDRPDGGPARFERQEIAWRRCQEGPDDGPGRRLDAAGAQCAQITVPLDHARPGGRTVEVALSRLRASGPGERRGALLINPGGPGDPGRIYAALLKGHAPALAARYDLIGMDPRFAGRSTPVDCRWPIGDYLRSAGRDRRAFDRSVALARDPRATTGTSGPTAPTSRCSRR